MSPVAAAFADEGVMLRLPPGCVTTCVALLPSVSTSVIVPVLVTPVGFADTE
jgi:hypothetical protein